ncbi:hypothetical protein [Paenibacillus ginsengarvi]|uniref:Bacterial Pleckstrin homology domain-containing protein n=1 Tax=Paenibacillus ginsengarvi TaxID=400777 RepID=A0A3B0BR21_9BACL|nr:hypothetical protein [Paenibacillus ginsengarvi]RKN74921.1 hypothetical protein D7M11_26970 [Paenibacillus ginsengarvi]
MFEQTVHMSRRARMLIIALGAVVFAAAVLPLFFVREDTLSVWGSVITGSAILAVLFAILWPFTVLRVRVDTRSLTVGFGLLKERVMLEQIVSCQKAAYRWQDWGGWGIRLKPGSKLYNVAGDGGVAVQVNLENGRRILFSSTDPDAVCRALTRRRPEIEQL